MAGGCDVFRLRDEYIPVLRLYELFGVETDKTDLLDSLLVIVEAEGRRLGLLVDDVLATGGTLRAAAQLCEKTNHKVMAMLCIVDLTYLNSFEYKGLKVSSLITYNTP